MTTRRILGAKDPVPNGKILFVYRHIGTNQVLYSLRQSMKSNHVIRQLTFAGRHSIPNALRKDLWTPFFTVTFPSPAQGLDAYQKLREMRRLREFCWKKDPNVEAMKKSSSRLPGMKDLPSITEADTSAAVSSSTPSDPPSSPTKSEISTTTTRLANLKPGKLSTRQFVFTELLQAKLGKPLVGLPTREILREYLLDHKATAVADLAATFQLQQQMIPSQIEKQGYIQKATQGRAESYEPIGRKLARESNPLEIDEITSQINLLKADRTSVLEIAEQSPEDVARASDLKIEIQILVNKRFRISRALELFGEDGNRELTATEKKEIAAGRFHSLARKYREGEIPLPSAGSARNYILGGKGVAPFSLDGVHIQWAELYDAEYASSWPKEVVHSAMPPYVRHTAPDPRVPQLGSFSDFVQDQKVKFGVSDGTTVKSGELKEASQSFMGRWKNRLLGSGSKPVEANL